MRQAHITSQAKDMNYSVAATLAAKRADEDPEVIEPVLVAWYDRKAGRMSPAIEGADLRTRWHDYGESHDGRLEIDVGDDYAFIYADSSAFEPYDEACPYINVRDARGNEYICQTGLMADPHNPTPDACVPLDEWTSKLT
ncbi:MAG TPA: AF1514 family protein [Rhodocyclaceae bacterium]|nr:AF1514 family protein [Rhodocyclaceae bacterium]